MAFLLSDLIIESTIREGLENIRRDTSVIDDIFENLINLPIYKKYGEKEINKIKNIFENQEISIIHAFPPSEAKMPCISIQLLPGQENVRRAVMDDFWKDELKDKTKEELDAEIKVSNITLLSYDPDSGILEIDDSADLTNVHANQLLEDVDGNEFKILGGVNNVAGSKKVILDKGLSVNLAGPALIKTMFTQNQYEVRTNVEQEALLLGVHSKEALQTKYMFTVLKYIIESRKADLIRRGFQLATYESSDFSQNQEYQADFIYSRYLTVSGMIENSWNADKVIPIDLIDVGVKVEKDQAGNVALGREDQTIKVQEDE